MTRRAPPEAEELTLITTGRRSGRPHTVRLWFAREGDTLWLRADADADWYRNLVHEPRCRVRLGEGELVAVREPLDDEASALRHVVALWRAKYGAEWVADWYVERGRAPVRLRVTGASEAVRP